MSEATKAFFQEERTFFQEEMREALRRHRRRRFIWTVLTAWLMLALSRLAIARLG